VRDGGHVPLVEAIGYDSGFDIVGNMSREARELRSEMSMRITIPRL